MSDRQRMPFLRGATQRLEAEGVVVERPLSLDTDPVLAHHALINALDHKPALACGPVLPLTFIMELMAEVASCLAPGLGLIALEQVRARHWLMLNETVPELRLRLTARPVEPGDRERRVHVTGQLDDAPIAAFEGTAVFGHRYRGASGAIFAAPSAPRLFHRSPDDLYRQRWLFHGPLLQCIVDRLALDEHAIAGFLRSGAPPGLFPGLPQPLLLLDPVVLDGVAQLLAVQLLEHDIHSLPHSLDRLELFCGAPVAGTQVPAYVEVHRGEGAPPHASFEVQDGAGKVWMRGLGLAVRSFRWTSALAAFYRDPTHRCATRPLALTSPIHGAVACAVDKGDLRDMALEFVAASWLHADEMASFRGLPDDPARWRWLLERVAVKDAARLWLGRDQERLPHPASLAAEPAVDGVAVAAGGRVRVQVRPAGRLGFVAVAGAPALGEAQWAGLLQGAVEGSDRA